MTCSAVILSYQSNFDPPEIVATQERQKTLNQENQEHFIYTGQSSLVRFFQHFRAVIEFPMLSVRGIRAVLTGCKNFLMKEADRDIVLDSWQRCFAVEGRVARSSDCSCKQS